RSNTYGRPLISNRLVAGNTVVTGGSTGMSMTGQIVYRNSFAASTVVGWVVTVGGAHSAGAWASGQSYVAGRQVTAASGKVYLLVTAGGGTTANEPTHDYGEVTE